ncbi:MAG: PEGA domain-containing protein [Myxococcales bacterium]|nr:PEGA domain-containing protein [Myxococcales bacterium]
MTFSRTIASVVSLALVVGASEAVANKKKAAADPARAAYLRGAKLFDQHDYLGALEAFKRANTLRPHFLMECNIARCYERRAQAVKAAEHYRRCLATGGSKSPRASAIRKALASVSARIGTLVVESRGAGKVFVDGREHGPVPQRVKLDRGTHIVEVRRPSGATVRSSVDLRGGETRTLRLDVSAHTPPKTAKGGAAPSPARGETPATPARRGLSQVWFWIGVAATVALGVTTAVVGAQTLKANDDYEANPTQQGYDKVIDRRLLTNVMLGCTLAAAGGTTALFFFTDFGGGRGGARERGGDVASRFAGRGEFVVGVRGRF